MNERKAVKYHERLVAALRAFKLEDAMEYEERIDACIYTSVDAVREARTLLDEIGRES